MLLDRGYLGLTMDRIAEATEYSKGTIYQHFPNKEEIVLALAVRTAERRAEFFERAATFRGGTRERMAGIGIAEDLFVRLHPDHFRTERILDAQSIRQKTTDVRRQALESCDWRCANIVTGIVRDAIAQGDLTLTPPTTPIRLAMGLWTMAYGFYSIHTSGEVFEKLGIEDPPRALWHNYHTLLDGHGWQPHSATIDHEQVHTRILEEVFPDEFAQLKLSDSNG